VQRFSLHGNFYLECHPGLCRREGGSLKSKRNKWPESAKRPARKTTLQVLRGGRSSAPDNFSLDASAAELWKELGDLATDVVEKAGSVIEGPRRTAKRNSSNSRKKAA
jgi:hypothetical protein